MATLPRLKPTKFYDREVTNNFEAHATAAIHGADGKSLKKLAFSYYYGETPQTPRDEVHKRVELTCAYVILLELYTTEGFDKKVQPDKKAEFEKAVAFLKQKKEEAGKELKFKGANDAPK